MTFQTSPLDPYASAIQLWLNDYRTNQEIVELLKAEFDVETSEASVRRAIDRNQLNKPPRPQAGSDPSERPGVTYEGQNEATVTSNIFKQEDLDAIQLGDIEILLHNRGLDPNDWLVERVTVNEWDGNTGRPGPGQDAKIVTFRQLKIHLKRRVALNFILPAIDVPSFPRPKKAYKWDNLRLAVVLGDEQEPYSDPRVADSVLSMLEDLDPQIITHLGDLMDFPTISRHKDNPEWSASVQDCINAGYAKLRSYREAAPNATITYMVGNHDERLRNELLLRAERMYGVRPADKPGEASAIAALSPRNLLHLDELAIEYIEPNGGYAFAQVLLNNSLAVRHGWLTGENTAGKTLDRLGHSVIVGHTHHQRMVYKSVYDINGDPRVLTAVENGTLSQVSSGIGFAVNPDWQQGCSTAVLYEDDSFHIDLATFRDNKLYWRDKRF